MGKNGAYNSAINSKGAAAREPRRPLCISAKVDTPNTDKGIEGEKYRGGSATESGGTVEAPRRRLREEHS